MFIAVSFILIIPCVFLGVYLPIINNLPIYYSILFGITGFLIGFAASILILIFSFLFVGKIIEKKYDPLNKKRWKFMNAGSKYVLFWMNVKLTKVGYDNLNKDEHYIFFSNHQSFLDILTYDILLKDFPRGSLYKKEHENNAFLSGFAKGLGGVGIDRYNPKKARQNIEEAINEVKKGRNFMIYPEGTRSRDGKVHKYHPGCFRIGMESNEKIVITVIDGLYHWYNYIPLIPKHFYSEVLEIIDKEEYSKYTTVDFAKTIEEKVNKRIIELRNTYKYLK